MIWWEIFNFRFRQQCIQHVCVCALVQWALQLNVLSWGSEPIIRRFLNQFHTFTQSELSTSQCVIKKTLHGLMTRFSLSLFFIVWRASERQTVKSQDSLTWRSEFWSPSGSVSGHPNQRESLYLVSWQSLEIPRLKIHINDGTVISISAVERRAEVSFSWVEGEFTAVSMSGSTASPHPASDWDVNSNNSRPSSA